LKVQFRGEANVVTDAGTIKSVELVGDKTSGSTALKDHVTFAPVDAGVSWTHGATALAFYQATKASDGVITYTDNTYTGQEYTLTVDATLQAYALVSPVDALKATTEEYILRVVRTVNGSIKTDYVPFDLFKADGSEFAGNTAGHAFTVTVNYLEPNVIKALAKVTEWIEEGESIAGVSAN
jgi:hypothetical protein